MGHLIEIIEDIILIGPTVGCDRIRSIADRRKHLFEAAVA